MRSRSTLAAGVLLTAALVTTGTAAHAASAKTLDVTVTAGKKATISTTSFRPGNTVFTIKGKGTVEILSLKKGYTLDDLVSDFGNLFSGDTDTIKRVDKKVVFWGGAHTSGAGAEIGIKLPAGSYYAVDLDHAGVAPFEVTGAPETRSMPHAAGDIAYVKDMTYAAPDHLARDGWVRFTNRSTEPHFTEFSKLKEGTTRAEIKKYLASGSSKKPSFIEKEFHEAMVVSPGHSFVYDLHASAGDYAELCFWPSDETGMPHALMGMFDVSTLS